MARMFADDVQKIMGVQDLQVIAYGYTFSRLTVEIFFRQGRLVRRIDGTDSDESVHFNAHYSTQDIKRFYADSLHPWLAQQFETFGLDLSLTPGGPNQTWGYYVQDVR